MKSKIGTTLYLFLEKIFFKRLGTTRKSSWERKNFTGLFFINPPPPPNKTPNLIFDELYTLKLIIQRIDAHHQNQSPI